MNELTKSEKRKCRELIQLGLNRECAKFVEQIRNLSQTTSEDPHAQYIAIYRKTRTFDKHVAWRYDDMRGSKYLPTVASLLADKVIREDEIVGFSDENREHILRSASIRRPDGKSSGYIHDVVWQLTARFLIAHVCSQNEFEACFRRLEQSARTWRVSPTSMNYLNSFERRDLITLT